MTQSPSGYVVRADGAGEAVYLDDTGGAVHDPAQAKVFLTEVDARAGLAIAELAPIGSARNWRIEPVSHV
jgi:hypothetical protein